MSEPTPLHVTSALADQASTQGHDAIALRTDAFVVVDGASPLDDANGIAAARLARAVADDLADALPVSSLAAAVASAVQATATLQPEDEVLSAAFAAAWLDGDLMRVAVIGDCVVVGQLADGRVEVVTDRRVPVLDARAVAERERLRRAGVSEDEVERYFTAQLRRHRTLANTPAGYWIISTDPSVGDHAQTAGWPVSDVLAMLLCTDGYWSAVEPFGLVASASELVEETAARGARQIVDAIRDAERRDPEARAYPRVDTADDASVVCLRR